MNHVLILSLSDLANDPRVDRQVGLLADRFTVTAAGFAPPRMSGVAFVPIPHVPRSFVGKINAVVMLKLGMFERYYWSSIAIKRALLALERNAFDLILANDLGALPLACRLPSRCGVIFDAHEYSPREFEDRFGWRVLFQDYYGYLCRTYLPKVNGMLAVCQTIADEYRDHYGITPAVLMNAAPYHDLTPRQTHADQIRVVHHGVVLPSRKIELMISMTEYLDDRFHLDLYLVPNASRYFQDLVALAARHPRVRILPPVPMAELPRVLNDYDIGLYLLPPTNFNYQFVLPNKFFEFIQARLAVAIAPSPEMARLVRQYDCGIVSDDFNPRSLAKRLNELDTERIDYYKQHSHLAAKDLCFEKNSEVLLNMVNRLLGTA